MRLNPDTLTLLGFAQKSNKLVSGDSAVEALLKKHKIKLLILAADLSTNRQKHYINWSNDIKIPCLIGGNKVELGIALGVSPRAVIGIIDEQMANAILQRMS